jgi:hypothetical protein
MLYYYFVLYREQFAVDVSMVAMNLSVIADMQTAMEAYK